MLTAMIRYVSRRFHKNIPFFQKILRQDHWLCFSKKDTPTRELSSALLNKYRDDKYAEIRKRLDAVPYLKMVEKEEDRLLQDLFYEKDEALRGVLKDFSEAFDYHTSHGKKIRTPSLLKSYILKAFCAYGFSMDDSTWNQWDSEKWRQAIILTWSMELLGAFGLIIDDILDQSTLRRGRPCWHTKPDVGIRAVNDALFFLFGSYKILLKHFSGSKFYLEMLEKFLQEGYYIPFAFGIDMKFNQKPRFDMFTFENYISKSIYQTSNIIFCLPLHSVMYLAGVNSEKEFEFTRELCLKFGVYCQIQNDYLDFFGKTEETGKIGNDIAQGKCSWLALKFLEVASEPMKRKFYENYGIDDKDAISNVVELYRNINLREMFREYEAQFSAEMIHLIESKNDIKGALFYEMFTQIYNKTYKV